MKSNADAGARMSSAAFTCIIIAAGVVWCAISCSSRGRTDTTVVVATVVVDVVVVVVVAVAMEIRSFPTARPRQRAGNEDCNDKEIGHFSLESVQSTSYCFS